MQTPTRHTPHELDIVPSSKMLSALTIKFRNNIATAEVF